MPGPTQMQKLVMEIVNNLHAELKKTRPDAPHPTRDEIHVMIDWDKPSRATTTRLRSLIERGWLSQHKYPGVKGYVYQSTAKYQKEKNNPPLINRGAKPESKRGYCDCCGELMMKVNLFCGKYLCRRCMCPDEKLSVFDYMYSPDGDLNLEIHGYGV